MVCPAIIEAQGDPLLALEKKSEFLNKNILDENMSTKKNSRKRKFFQVDPSATQTDVKVIKMSKVHKLNQKYKPYDRGKD